MKPIVKRWVGWVGYPSLYVLLLALFARCTFPYERVRDRLVSEFNVKQASAGMRIEIAEMSGYWLSGIEAEGVKVTRTSAVSATPAPTADAAEEQKPHVTLIDHVYGSVSLLRLLFGTT